ncbi:hypothetical protein HD553DRAFT_345710 [Filobasidium floriforme]|uniref:uncharacterized protein n=1 Tax=Filobasidium floriforme TaxID=5210 RepID=UPI001E8D19F1|nr:uncharacterized protein HD553DRAFT_345710 [Filobasidium floriforme]KAH8079365.1 hypothetical protein HD553DRAFT_345710 [Filobasidium floriforme]
MSSTTGNGSASNRPKTPTQDPAELVILPIAATGPPADEVDRSRHYLKLVADMSTVLNGLDPAEYGGYRFAIIDSPDQTTESRDELFKAVSSWVTSGAEELPVPEGRAREALIQFKHHLKLSVDLFSEFNRLAGDEHSRPIKPLPAQSAVKPNAFPLRARYSSPPPAAMRDRPPATPATPAATPSDQKLTYQYVATIRPTETDAEALHNALMRAARRARLSDDPSEPPPPSLHVQLPSIPAALSFTSVKPDLFGVELPQLSRNAERVLSPPSLLFTTDLPETLRKYARYLIAHCDTEQRPVFGAESTHLTCPAPEVTSPPSWYQTSPTAIALIEEYPRIYSSLAKGEWLNDQVIDAYLTLIHWRQSTYQLLPSGRVPTFVHSSQICPAIQTRYTKREQSLVPMATWFEKENLDPFDYRFHALPWNITQFHWFAVVIDIPAKNIAILDSLSHVPAALEGQNNIAAEDSDTGNLALARCRKHFQMIGTWLSELHLKFRGTPLVQAEWSFSLPPVPQQEDSSNCGVFMLQHIEAICRIQDLGAVCNQPAPKHDARRHMAIELAQNRLQRRHVTDEY